ncbi:MAG: Hsp33 family molecular chaperone HslO [Proteobacteria bacterium]|nr:Hsp33 family molecular chaperone HslO [Pseudomonadota bacterium]
MIASRNIMRVHRFVTNDLTIRVAAVDATAAVQEMQKLQNAMPLATIGMGRAMVGALLMSSQLKPGQEVGILLKGNGPLGSLYAQSNYEGQVRAYCPHPEYIAHQEEDFLNLKKALGFGQLTISRQQPFQKQPFYGTVEMVSGEVGEDIAHYLHQSHQIRSLVSLGVYLDSYGKVKSAGGLLLEVMPGVEETVVDKVQKNADSQQEAVSKLILAGQSPEEFVRPYLEGIPFTELPHPFEVKYFCPCTPERVKGALSTLGITDLEEMIAQKQDTEVQCQMCGRRYDVKTEELESLKENLRKSSMH